VPDARVQVVELKVPVLFVVNVTVPVGATAPVPEASATVAVHAEAVLSNTLAGEQATVVVEDLMVGQREGATAAGVYAIATIGSCDQCVTNNCWSIGYAASASRQRAGCSAEGSSAVSRESNRASWSNCTSTRGVSNCRRTCRSDVV